MKAIMLLNYILRSRPIILGLLLIRINTFCCFPGGAVVKNLPANAGDMGSNPGLGRSHMLQSN